MMRRGRARVRMGRIVIRCDLHVVLVWENGVEDNCESDSKN